MTKKLLLFIFTIILFTGCSQKQEVQEYNKPAVYWYNKILKQISMGQLDEADDTFTSLESEHRNSPLIAPSMMILVNAHMDEEEYEMANYYLDEYLKRFAFQKDLDNIRYLKIKSKFMSFQAQYREQQLIIDIIEDIEEFQKEFPNSQYVYLTQTMKTRLQMAKSSFDQEIADLYERIEKPEASKVYAQKAKNTFENQDDIVKVKTPWYKDVFENGVFNLWN